MARLSSPTTRPQLRASQARCSQLGLLAVLCQPQDSQRSGSRLFNSRTQLLLTGGMRMR